MSRVAWVTLGYPPDRGGVSDHSFEMVSGLRAQGHDILVCTKPHQSGFIHLHGQIQAFEPNVVVVAYAPLGFAPRTGGIAPALTCWCALLRTQRHARTLLLAHEASLPLDELWARRELKLTLLAAGQVAQFEILARCFDRVAFSHEGARAIWARRLPRLSARLQTIRICSNIPRVTVAEPRAELRAAGFSVPAKTILFFGSGHESVLFDFVEAAWVALLKFEPDARLIIVGVDLPKLRRLRPTLAEFGSRVQALGFVPAHEVSLWLQVADLVLAPFVEGVSARKGTVMAAFQHGCAVVTTTGFHTRDDIPWARLCALAPLDKAAFAEMATRCLGDASWRQQLGAAAQVDYDAHASPPVTAAQLLASALGA